MLKRGMSNLGMERRHLDEANRHIAGSERRIEEQEALVDHLRSLGLDTGEALRLLANFRDVLGEMRVHRQAILAALGNNDDNSDSMSRSNVQPDATRR